jgi:hypothetical protein
VTVASDALVRLAENLYFNILKLFEGKIVSFLRISKIIQQIQKSVVYLIYSDIRSGKTYIE